MGTRARKVVWALVATATGLYAVGRLTGSQGVSALLENRRKIAVLEEETSKLELENKAKRAYLDDLKANPDAQRRLVREKLHYVDPGSVDFATPKR